MAGLIDRLRTNPKTIATVLLPLALLVVLIVATGASNPFGGGSHSSSSSAPTAAPAVASHQSVQANLSVHVTRVRDTTWRFDYTVHNSGKTPLAGFQLDAARANLYNVYGKGGWAVFGNGICGGNYSNLLVYWSTGSRSPAALHPGGSARFGFTVQTTRPAAMTYSLSWGNAAAQFGTTQGPASSSLRARGPCK